MKNNYLSVKNLNFEYPDGFKALSNINFQIKKTRELQFLVQMVQEKQLLFFI